MRHLALVTGSMLLATTALQAADMRLPVKAPPPVVAPFSWTGFYVGGNVGGVWSDTEPGTYDGPVLPPFALPGPPILIIPGTLGSLPLGSGRNSTWLGGGQAGYNWQANQFVFGIEADVDATGINNTANATASRFLGTTAAQTLNVNLTTEVDWAASLRGRAGIAFDRLLLYATGGGAVADIKVSGSSTVANGPGTFLPAGTFAGPLATASETRWGWTAGAGFEWAFDNNWSFGAEYRHSDFGRFTVSNLVQIPDGFGTLFATGPGSVRLTMDQATARLNYRFGPR
jgi:outer membrane immunogenic protein